jgi:hypothetical protein
VCTQLEPKQDSDQYKQLLEIKPSQTEGCICDNVKLFLNWENVTHSGQIAMIMLITTEQIDKELTKKKKNRKNTQNRAADKGEITTENGACNTRTVSRKHHTNNRTSQATRRHQT